MKKVYQVLVVVVSVLASVLAPMPAGADWQFTRWGMTVEEVLDASGGNATAVQSPDTADGMVALLEMPWVSGVFRFNAKLYFDGSSRRLAMVQLKLLDRTLSSRLVGAMREKYGVPEIDNGAVIVWRTETDMIRMVNIMSSLIHYSPQGDANTDGL